MTAVAACARAALLMWALAGVGGCGEATTCPILSAGTRSPAPITASVERLSTDLAVLQLVVADDGLYWHDGTTIFALPRGQAEAIQLFSLPAAAANAAKLGSSQAAITGLVVDTDRVYWSEGHFYLGSNEPGYSPPGELFSMPKSGGAAESLLDLPDRTLTPVAVQAARLILQVSGTDANYYQLGKDGQPPLQPLVTPALYETSRVVGAQIYWTEPDVHTPQLYRVGLDGGTAESLARIESGDYDVGPDYVLWRHDQLITQPELLLRQNFVIWREANGSDNGCVQALPGAGESISSGTALDAEYAYWHSFNALGAVSMSSDGTASPLPEMGLLRVDLKSGALQRLEAPGFSWILGDQIVGLDAGRVLVSTGSGLVAVSIP